MAESKSADLTTCRHPCIDEDQVILNDKFLGKKWKA